MSCCGLAAVRNMALGSRGDLDFVGEKCQLVVDALPDRKQASVTAGVGIAVWYLSGSQTTSSNGPAHSTYKTRNNTCYAQEMSCCVEASQ